MSQPKPVADAVPPACYAHEHMRIKECKHGTFLFNIHDTFLGRSLDLYGQCCEDELDLLRQIVRPGELVVEVGANIGAHTVFLARQVGDQGCVLAFEPRRILFQNLCANIVLNALVNVIARQQEPGSRTGTIRLMACDPRHDANFANIHIEDNAHGEPVALVRIDDLGLDRCDLIKVSGEGMGCEALEGARATIARYRPGLYVKNNLVERSAATITLVDSLGYDAFWHVSGTFRPDNFFKNATNVFAGYPPNLNLLCFHRGHGLETHGLPKVSGAQDTWQLAVARAR